MTHRVLFIDDAVPEPKRGAGYPRAYAMVKMLAELGYSVTVLPVRDGSPLQPATSELQSWGVEVLHSLTDPHDWLAHNAPTYDTAIVSRPHNAEWLKYIEAASPLTRRVYDAEAVWALREQRKAELNGLVSSTDGIRAEIEYARSAHQVLVVTKVEQQLFKHYLPDMKVTIWGMPILTQPTPATFEDRHDILMVGHMSTEPNVDAILWLLHHVVPTFYQQTDGRLILVGGEISPMLERMLYFAQPVVQYVGQLDDLTDVMNRARVFIAPHRYAAGIPIKVLTAMSFGVPTCISSLLAAQLGSDARSACVTFENEANVCTQLIKLYTNTEEWQSVRDNALAFIAHYGNQNYWRDVLHREVLGECDGA